MEEGRDGGREGWRKGGRDGEGGRETLGYGYINRHYINADHTLAKTHT